MNKNEWETYCLGQFDLQKKVKEITDGLSDYFDKLVLKDIGICDLKKLLNRINEELIMRKVNGEDIEFGSKLQKHSMKYVDFIDDIKIETYIEKLSTEKTISKKEEEKFFRIKESIGYSIHQLKNNF